MTSSPGDASAAPDPLAGVDLSGLVDLHCHGGGGGEFGTASGRVAARFHREAGTGTVLASLASLAPDDLVRAVRECGPLVAEGLVGGIHLEGPFLSTARCGAQNPAVLTDVSPALVERVAEAARDTGGRIVQMTYAPERDPSGVLPGLLAEIGAVAALGHTDCSAAEASRALDAMVAAAPTGTRPLVTHLFNGMPPLHHRSPGPVGAALAAAGRGEVTVEVVGDGVHLAPETVKMLFDTLGADSIALITDAMAAAGMADGSYTLAGLDVTVRDGTARLTQGDSIAGGTATLAQVVRRVVAAGVSVQDALTAATTTPASTVALA